MHVILGLLRVSGIEDIRALEATIPQHFEIVCFEKSWEACSVEEKQVRVPPISDAEVVYVAVETANNQSVQKVSVLVSSIKSAASRVDLTMRRVKMRLFF